MVLSLKRWKSRSSPGIEARATCITRYQNPFTISFTHVPNRTVAGWSSPVARQAHNLKVTGSNPVPATKLPKLIYRTPKASASGGFLRSRANALVNLTPRGRVSVSAFGVVDEPVDAPERLRVTGVIFESTDHPLDPMAPTACRLGVQPQSYARAWCLRLRPRARSALGAPGTDNARSLDLVIVGRLSSWGPSHTARQSHAGCRACRQRRWSKTRVRCFGRRAGMRGDRCPSPTSRGAYGHTVRE